MTDSPTRLLAAVLVLAGGAACAPAMVRTDEGVAVGNPGNLRVSVAPIEDATFASNRLQARALLLVDCDGGEVSVVDDLDLALDPIGVVEVPADRWCGIVLEDATLDLTIFVDSTEREAPRLSWSRLRLTGKAGSSAEDDLALWLGSPYWAELDELVPWITGDEGEEEDDDDEITTEDIAEVIAEDSTLLVDGGQDGPDEDDRVVASGDEDEDDDNDEDDDGSEPVEAGGCGQEEEVVRAFGLLMFGLGGLGLRRRRLTASDDDGAGQQQE